MADERVITLRFKEENFPDMELYHSLEKEKRELGFSMPVYVKDILRRHFEGRKKEQKEIEINSYLEQMQNIVHEELSSLNAMIVEMAGGMSMTYSDSAKKTTYEDISNNKDEEILPKYSEELPEGMDSILEQFM